MSLHGQVGRALSGLRRWKSRLYKVCLSEGKLPSYLGVSYSNCHNLGNHRPGPAWTMTDHKSKVLRYMITFSYYASTEPLRGSFHRRVLRAKSCRQSVSMLGFLEGQIVSSQELHNHESMPAPPPPPRHPRILWDLNGMTLRSGGLSISGLLPHPQALH